MKKIDFSLLQKGDRKTLSKAITLIESELDSHRKLASELLNNMLIASQNVAIRLGISGVPGVGKSTFIESLGLFLISNGYKVAVLTIDPSSPLSGGSILGDKSRMEKLSREENAFIRPSASTGHLGGVHPYTRESIFLCEAAGFDYIIIETVGVGQSEFEIASMVDCFIHMVLPNSGDEIQGIKKGIMEITDGAFINKADGDSLFLAEQSKNEITNALMYREDGNRTPPFIETISSKDNINIDLAFKKIQDFILEQRKTKRFDVKRSEQLEKWHEQLIEIELLKSFKKSICYTEAKKLKKIKVYPRSELQEFFGNLFK